MPKGAIATESSADSAKRKAGHRPTGSVPDEGAGLVREASASTGEWTGFASGRWQQAIDVRDFIQRNVRPYDGDEAFLAAPSERTERVWAKLRPYFQEEIRRGVL